MGETLIYQSKPLNNKHNSNPGLIPHIKHVNYKHFNVSGVHKAILYATQNWLLLYPFKVYLRHESQINSFSSHEFKRDLKFLSCTLAQKIDTSLELPVL